jgi:hypothetical protein
VPRPVGIPTRGTTGTNRLRRADRWMTHSPRVRAALQTCDDPVVVDLGYRLETTSYQIAIDAIVHYQE